MRLLSKAAVRDIGRVLQMPYGQVDRLSKMIPVEGVKPVSIEKALKDEPRLREEARSEEVVDRLLTYGQQVEGLLRNASTHAAGVVIGDRPLDALGASVSGPAVRHARNPIQYEMGRTGRVGEVRLSGSEDANGDPERDGYHLQVWAALACGSGWTELYEPADGAENQINAIRWMMRQRTSSTPQPKRWPCSRWNPRA